MVMKLVPQITDDNWIIKTAAHWHELQEEIYSLKARRAELDNGPLARFKDAFGMDPRGSCAGGWSSLKEKRAHLHALLVEFEPVYIACGADEIEDRLTELWAELDPISDSLQRAAPCSVPAICARARVMTQISRDYLISYQADEAEIEAAEVALEDIDRLAAA